MPFPWKKNKVKRISQIVSDLQSPKHGGSLVVETGFPTSLIDLFVKNKDRFKRSKAKKRTLSIESRDSVHLTCLNNPEVVSAEPSHTEGPSLTRRVTEEGCVRDHGVVLSGQDQARIEGCDRGLDSHAVFNSITILKVFLAVVLALCTKKLTLGVTISAFVLVLLEYVGKHVPFISLKTLGFWVSDSVLFRKVLLVIERINFFRCSKPPTAHGEATVSEVLGGVELRSCSPIEQIEIVETSSAKDVIDEQINGSGPQLDIPTGNGGETELGVDKLKAKAVGEGEGSVSKYKVSRCGKLKSKLIKKFAPKKYRVANNEKKLKVREGVSRSEVLSLVEDYQSAKSEKEYVRKQEPEDICTKSSSLILQEQICKEGKEEVGNGTTGSNELLLPVGFKLAVNGKGEIRDRDDQNLVYLILILIVLAGLLGGRLVALALTVTCCFMSKVLKTQWNWR